MTRKTVKDLEKEITNLKEQFHDLKNNFNTLSVKHEGLEKDHNQCMSKSKQILIVTLVNNNLKSKEI